MSEDGAGDGSFTVQLAGGSGGRTITRIQLVRNGGGVWDTVPGNGLWVAGIAPSLDELPLRNQSNGSINYQVVDGGRFVIFAADAGGLFGGANFVLTLGFADGTESRGTVTIGSA